MKKRNLPSFITLLIVFSALILIRPVSSGFFPPAEQMPDHNVIADPVIPVEPPDTPEPTAPAGQDPETTAGPPEIIEPPKPTEPPGLPEFAPIATADTDPDILFASTATMAYGEIVNGFSFDRRIDLGYGEDYSYIEGITAFRGNNFRDTASYGSADIRNAKFGDKWSRDTGTLVAPDGAVWTGHGWTGQPLIVKWPKQTREIMNMHSWAKEKDGLVEVIYAAMDGYIYFSELETGRDTRNRLFIGYTFKGSGSLDPRGYPLLYVGAGYDSSRGSARIFIISLVDGSVLHTFGNGDSFAPRGWPMADASPLVDAENDRLIYPSENGVLYIIDLNSEFDPDAGTMTISPASPVKWRFVGKRSHKNGQYWLGFESSPAIWRGHIFLADNGGHFVCLDLNTLEPVWVFDSLDDTNTSPVLAIEYGHPYIYLSTGFHGGWRAPTGSTAQVPIWKIDAKTGRVVWQTDYFCNTVSGLSGGVQGTIALGKNDLDDLIFVPVARTPTVGAGILSAIDKRTGEVIWEFRTNSYTWSSPVCVYDNNGKGYIVYCTANGDMHLLDGQTGAHLDKINLGGTIEASPAIYDSTIVIGTRSTRIWGIKLT